MAVFIKTDNEAYYAIITDGVEIKEGEYKQFYDNGNLKILCYYNNNKLNGHYILYNYDKTINKCSFYNNNVLEGEEIQYYEHFGRRPMRKSFYTNGKLDGKTELYNDDGKLEWTMVYDNGNIKSPYKKHKQCNIL
jgi:antitoxin component YwqK of YwqJK toxin-antitoxin module